MRAPEAIVIGTSAGALESLSAVLPMLPEDYALPVMVVVHLPPDKKSIMAELLQRKCAMKVREAEDKEPIEPGTIYLAPPDYHLLVEPDRRLSLSSEEPVRYSRPSIDVLFDTAADAYGETLLGVILSGANSDGAQGLKTILAAGGQAVVQRPETAYSAAMPQAALEINPDAHALNLDRIGLYLQKLSPIGPR